MKKPFVLRHILLILVFTCSNALAQEYPLALRNADVNETQPEAQDTPAPRYFAPDPNAPLQLTGPVNAPVILKPTADDQNPAVGVFTAAQQPQAENALDIVRMELTRVAHQEQEKHEKDGWKKTVVKRFPPESMTFFIAVGAVTFNSIWINSHGDPLAMEKHILSLKDPIAHLSFAAFMAANGFYIDLKTSKMDAYTKSRMMSRLSYEGMAVGSLASSVISDLGQSGKMCIDYWILGHNDEKSIAACNQAWKHWTVRNKFQQYFPQIIAMWASQAAAGLAESVVKKGFMSMSSSELARKFLSKDFAVKTARQITGAEVAFAVGTGGGSLGIKAIRWVSSAAKISTFLIADHLLSGYAYRPLNNLIKPALFDFDAFAINNFWSAADQINWDDNRLAEADKIVCTSQNPNCAGPKLIKEIENFGTRMQEWRDHLNSDAESDIAGWMEMTKKLLNQINYSYKFYDNFISSLFESLNAESVNKSNGLPPGSNKNISYFPFRTLPLYGVSLGAYTADDGGSTDNFYLMSTAEMERKQEINIHNAVASSDISTAKLEQPENDKLKSIKSRLVSHSRNQMQSALVELNQILGINSIKSGSDTPAYSQSFIDSLKQLRTYIGNPMPIVYPFAGFAQAFAINTNYETAKMEADFSLWSFSRKYLFSKESDLLTYKVFCGNKKSSIYTKAVRPLGIGNEINFISPEFDPPGLLKKDAPLNEFCSSWKRTRNFNINALNENLYGTKIGGKSMEDFFMQNLDYSIIGDYTNDKNAGVFKNWWTSNAVQPIESEFQKYDEKFKALVATTKESIFGQKEWYKFNRIADFLNQSKYLQKTIQSNLKFETNFYLQIISRALEQATVKPLADKNVYLEKVIAASKENTFKSVTGQSTLPEVQKVQDLFNEYYQFLIPEKVEFDQYIAHSKKIDTAINDLLVLAKLKTCAEALNLPALTDDLSADEKAQLESTPSASGSETSPKTYTDVPEGKRTLRQQAIAEAVKGLRLVESELRRFVRMKITLAQTLHLDIDAFTQDLRDNLVNPKDKTGPGHASPFGN